MLHLQNFDIIRIVIPQTAKSEHHAGKDCLDRLFFIAGSGEGQGDAGIVLFDPNLGLCAAHIIDGGFSHGHNSGNGGADDITARFSIAAVPGDGESGDSFVLGKKFTLGHILNYRAILVISTLV